MFEILGLGRSRGRHGRSAWRTACSGHHYDVVMTGWVCCWCGDKVSSRRAQPQSMPGVKCRTAQPHQPQHGTREQLELVNDPIVELVSDLAAAKNDEITVVLDRRDLTRRRLARDEALRLLRGARKRAA